MLKFDDNNAVHQCGSSYAYCDGNCNGCERTTAWSTNSTTTTESMYDTDVFGKPSKEAYERAKQNRMFASNSLQLCRKRRDELIDALAKERDNEKHYMELYEMNRDIIRKYEIYEVLDNNG